jgi:hypothetical protein
MLPQFEFFFNLNSEGEMLQNRPLHSFPKINIMSLMSASFARGLNEYIWDHLPLRENFLSFDHWIDYYIFNDSPIPEEVLLGKEEWLFLYPSVMDWPKKNAQEVEKFVKLSRIATELQRKTGKQILIIPSPSKASIYPEFLSNYHQKEYLKFASIFHKQLQTAALNTNSLFLLWEPFRNEKNRLLNNKQTSSPINSRTRFLFRPRDRHFNWETSVFQTKIIIDRIFPGAWNNNIYDNYFDQYKFQKSEMEKRFIKINLPEPYHTFLFENFMKEFQIVKEEYPVKKTKGNIVVFKAGITTDIKPLPKKLVVVHDSFFVQSQLLMAPYIKESTYMHWSISENFSFFMETIIKADILIIQSVEDAWSWRLDLLERILKELYNNSI